MGVLELLGKRIVFFDGAMGTIYSKTAWGLGNCPSFGIWKGRI